MLRRKAKKRGKEGRKKEKAIWHTKVFTWLYSAKKTITIEVEKVTDKQTPQRIRDRQRFTFLCVLKIGLKRGREKHEVQHFVADPSLKRQRTQHISNPLKINSEDNWKAELALYVSSIRPAWYLYATCWLALNWSTARIMQKKTPKEPRLPASHHLAQAHHVNFMTTACYRCQFFALSRIHWDTHKSLGHSSFIMLVFVFIWRSQWKI